MTLTFPLCAEGVIKSTMGKHGMRCNAWRNGAGEPARWYSESPFLPIVATLAPCWAGQGGA